MISLDIKTSTEMVTMTIKVHAPLNKRQELFQTLHSLAWSTRRKEGCMSINIYIDTENEDCTFLVEEWKAQADLDEHLLSRDFAVLFGALSLLHEGPGIEIRLLRPAGGLEMIEAVRGSGRLEN